MENLDPVTWSIGAAAMQFVLHQFPGIGIVLVVGHCVVEASLEDRFQLAVFHVASNADADFAQEHDYQEDGELKDIYTNYSVFRIIIGLCSQKKSSSLHKCVFKKLKLSHFRVV